MGHTEYCEDDHCDGECVRTGYLEENGLGECQECGEEFELEKNPKECPHCEEWHGYGGDPGWPYDREDFHSDG